MEEILFDDGQRTNPNLADYSIPSIRDIPNELISVCIEPDSGVMHGIGEMTLPQILGSWRGGKLHKLRSRLPIHQTPWSCPRINMHIRLKLPHYGSTF